MFEHLLSSDDDRDDDEGDGSVGPAIQTATEEFPGGGSETTYFLDGTIIGYSESYGSEGENQTSTEYYDANHVRIGEDSYESEFGSNSTFSTTLEVGDIPTDDDGPVVDAPVGATHVIQETSESEYNYDGMTESYSSVHYYVAA